MCYGCPGFNNSDIKKRTFRRVTKNGRVEFSVPVYTKDGRFIVTSIGIISVALSLKDGIQQINRLVLSARLCTLRARSAAGLKSASTAVGAHRCKECGRVPQSASTARQRRYMQRVRMGLRICEHGRERLACTGVRWGANLPSTIVRRYSWARRRGLNLRARSSALSVQWRVSNLRARSSALSVQGVRRGLNLREHDRLRYGCKECGGSGICEHGRQRYRCKVRRV